ncbi:MAG: A/G-specific adenine glycosylase [Sorangiineae bacterium]|nr:A/G-specific adenine glycosylase [Polyangiaceae bacterium]MEB2322098.1 A/G-specific adenine glycosylase [Sorangiineae bacterium]
MKASERRSGPRPTELARRLLVWFDANRRELPWRATRDPYAVWVSEVMLQQTQVTTVTPYYLRFMERFPDLEALARASEHEVLHVWQGLGYYSRARNLLAGARAVVERHAGRVPSEVRELTRLPGIGPYSAGAIASIAYERRVPLIDGNVVRVLTRLYALPGDPKRAPLARELAARAAALVPAERPGDFNQALMELGATVCVPRAPRCEACPLAKLCLGRARGVERELPELPKRAPPEPLTMVAAIVERRGRVLVRQVPPEAPRWAGLWQFPNRALDPGEPPERALGRLLGARVERAELMLRVRHRVTRYLVTLDAYRATPSERLRIEGARWSARGELGELAMPAAHRKLARALG